MGLKLLNHLSNRSEDKDEKALILYKISFRRFEYIKRRYRYISKMTKSRAFLFSNFNCIEMYLTAQPLVEDDQYPFRKHNQN
jgi:hypothetical protein